MPDICIRTLKKGDVIKATNGGVYVLLEDSFENRRTSYVTNSAKVEDKKSGRVYFIKYAYNMWQDPMGDSHSNKEGVSNLERESRFIMHYPYIEHVYAGFEAEAPNGAQIFCVLLEYVEGEDLMTCRLQKKEPDEPVMFRQMMQFLYGVRYYMTYSHIDGYVHRDLKPENIMISKSERVIICDFDISHAGGSISTDKVRDYNIGTAGYMDPRAARCERFDVKMDFYAIGRLFFFWMEGRHYFTDEEKGGRWPRYMCPEEEKLAYGMEVERFKSQKRFKEPKYAGLIKIISKMVAEPENRYENITDIIKDMEAFLIEYFGGVEAYMKNIEECILLKESAARYVQSYVSVAYNRREGGITVITLENYRMHEISVPGRPVMSIYNLDGKVYYIPYSESLRKRDEDGGYLICSGDQIQIDDDYNINFIIC